MKVSRIQIDNVLGVKSVDVKLSAPIALFTGKNGSGKSSVQESVRMAITRDTVRGISLKKEYGSLVHEGEKAGGAQVMIEGDEDGGFAFNLPKGVFSGPEITESMRVSLFGQRFASMTPDERRTFLFDLTKCKRNGEAVKARMMSEKWACQEAKIDAVLPLLRTGFPDVCAHAKAKATECKGLWRGLTNAVYGPVTAAKWEALVPDMPAGDAAELENTVAGLDKNIASMTESLGAIRGAARAAQEAAAKRANLESAVAKIPGLTDQLERAKAERDEYLPIVESLQARAAGTGKVNLIDELAHFIATAPIPDLGKSFEDEASALLEKYEATGADYGVSAGKVDLEAQYALPEHEKGLLVLQNRVTNLQRDLDSATQAKGQYDTLAPAGEAVDASAEIAEVEELLKTVKADRQKAENQRLDIVAAIRNRSEASEKTKKAMAHHNEVVEWTKVAEALAPDGIPAELLQDAIKPVNATLAQAAMDTEWAKVVIKPDMSITADGRQRQLLSESEQWRSDAMIAQAVAELSGLKILMLDRVDVLDLPGRGQLFGWMDMLADMKLIDTALLFATLKQMPEGLGDQVQCFWVEGGKIAGQRGS